MAMNKGLPALYVPAGDKALQQSFRNYVAGLGFEVIRKDHTIMWILEAEGGWYRLVWLGVIVAVGVVGFCNDLTPKVPRSFWPLGIRKPPCEFDLIMHESELTEGVLASEVCPRIFRICCDLEAEFDWPRFGEKRMGYLRFAGVWWPKRSVRSCTRTSET
jgi:hypothetical protein